MESNPAPPGISLGERDYLELWKYFQDRGGSLKDSFLGMMTWVLGFAAALAAFAADKALNWGQAQAIVNNPVVLLIVGIVGLGLTWFARQVIIEFGSHINRNFDRADAALRCDPTILASSDQDQGKPQELPTICRQVRVITYAFGAIFVVSVLLALARLVTSGFRLA